MEKAETGGGPPGRSWRIAGAVRDAGLVALSIRRVAAPGEGSRLGLTRSTVEPGATGGLLWRGAFDNAGDAPLIGVSAQVRFLDLTGKRLAELDAGRERLLPGEAMELSAPLPPGAAALQIVWLRWRTPRLAVEMGPYAPRELDVARQ